MKAGELLSASTNLAVIAAVAFLFLRPDGPVSRGLASWRQDRKVTATLDQRWEEFTAGGARLDNTAAPVALVEFGDYQCPACRQAHDELAAYSRDAEPVGILYRHLPLSIHPAADGAARSAVCAEEQGRFRQMHDRLFRTSQWQTDTNWVREAVAAGVSDTALFKTCLRNPQTRARLEEDKAWAKRLGIRATPSFVNRGGVYPGLVTQTELPRLLDPTNH